MTPTPDIDIGELRRLESEATPAPWELLRRDGNVSGDSDNLGWDWEGPNIPPEPMRGAFAKEADAKLIQNLRNAAPALLAAAEESRTALLAAEAAMQSAHDEIAALKSRLALAEKALKEIAESPHCSYGGSEPYVSEHQSGYRIGVADGHRCAANTARSALSIYEGKSE